MSAPAVRVRVPATSANLGPGFDACGLALGLYDEVTVAVTGNGLSIDVVGEDDGTRDETHLVVRALRAGFDELGLAPAGLRLSCRNRIPHGRGLGSSAAAIVAGLLAANALSEKIPEGRFPGVPEGQRQRDSGSVALPEAHFPGVLSGAELFALACRLEGHPDNVAATLYGGFTVAWYDGAGVPRVVRADPPDDLRPVVFVPQRRQLTAESRGALPVVVPHADAAVSAGRAALLAMVMAGTASWRHVLLAATDDRLHQPYRLPSMPETRDLLERLRGAGVAAVLSGSGPTVLAFPPSGEQARFVCEGAGGGFTVLDLPVDREGAQVGTVAD